MKTLKHLTSQIAATVWEAKDNDYTSTDWYYPLGDGTYLLLHWKAGDAHTPETLWFSYLDVTGTESEPQHSSCDPGDPDQVADWLDRAEDYINTINEEVGE